MLESLLTELLDEQACYEWLLKILHLQGLQFTAHDALREYKAQQSNERGFRFLKDPLFFTSSVFLKSAKRNSYNKFLSCSKIWQLNRL